MPENHNMVIRVRYTYLQTLFHHFPNYLEENLTNFCHQSLFEWNNIALSDFRIIKNVTISQCGTRCYDHPVTNFGTF